MQTRAVRWTQSNE